MLYSVKQECYYEVEANSLEELEHDICEHGVVNNMRFDYCGEWIYAAPLEKNEFVNYTRLDVLL